MPQPHPERRRARQRRRHRPLQQHCQQQGFTLLEVLVAMTLVGLGLALAFTAMSGSARTEERLAVHSAALQLARAKLDEALSQPDFQVAADPGEEHYAGHDFGYRLRLTPVPLLTEAQSAALPRFAGKLERIEIEVFWGPKGAQQSYQLATLRANLPPAPPPRPGQPGQPGQAPGQNANPGQPPAPQPGTLR